jgi:hypothetical protein
MTRKFFDILASSAGVIVVVVLVIAGGLLTWGHSFVNDNVHNQLAQQQIYFPAKAAFDHPKAGTEITPSMIPSVSQYAGQELLTGAQAKVYADDCAPRTRKEELSRSRVRRMRCCARDEGAGPVGLVALRGRPAGGGRKPPRGAPVKSRGAELVETARDRVGQV